MQLVQETTEKRSVYCYHTLSEIIARLSDYILQFSEEGKNRPCPNFNGGLDKSTPKVYDMNE